MGEKIPALTRFSSEIAQGDRVAQHVDRCRLRTSDRTGCPPPPFPRLHRCRCRRRSSSRGPPESPRKAAGRQPLPPSRHLVGEGFGILAESDLDRRLFRVWLLHDPGPVTVHRAAPGSAASARQSPRTTPRRAPCRAAEKPEPLASASDAARGLPKTTAARYARVGQHEEVQAAIPVEASAGEQVGEKARVLPRASAPAVPERRDARSGSANTRSDARHAVGDHRAASRSGIGRGQREPDERNGYQRHRRIEEEKGVRPPTSNCLKLLTSLAMKNAHSVATPLRHRTTTPRRPARQPPRRCSVVGGRFVCMRLCDPGPFVVVVLTQAEGREKRQPDDGRSGLSASTPAVASNDVSDSLAARCATGADAGPSTRRSRRAA